MTRDHDRRLFMQIASRGRRARAVTVTAFLLIATLLPLLAACGKRGAPSPPGPANEVTYPKVYPTE